MKKFLAINIVIILLFSGCFSTDVVEVELEHDEYIIVQSTLKKDSLFSGVRFTKTLSLNEPFDIEKAELKNVTAYLLIDSVVVIPLHYYSEGVYTPIYPHKVLGGALYELFAEFDGTKIYSRTNVPDTIITKRTKLSNQGYITTLVNRNPKYVYGAIWQVGEFYSNIKADEFHSIVPNDDYKESTVDVRTVIIPEEFLTSDLRTKIFAFDKFYRTFFSSKGSTKNDSLFSNVTSPDWNIGSTSPKVIGLFIGMSESKSIEVRR